MVVGRDMVKIVTHGTVTAAQGWSTGLWLDVSLTGGSWSAAQLNLYATDVDAFFATWWTTVKTINAADTYRRGTRAYFYPSSSGVATAQGEFNVSSPVAGNSSGYMLPTQAAIVASLRTPVPGRRGRGRSFAPAAGAPLIDHQLQSAMCTNIANAYKALIDSLNAYVSVPSNILEQAVVIRSDAGSISNPVTQVLVNSRPDTIRDRADKVASLYQASAAIA